MIRATTRPRAFEEAIEPLYTMALSFDAAGLPIPAQPAPGAKRIHRHAENYVGCLARLDRRVGVLAAGDTLHEVPHMGQRRKIEAARRLLFDRRLHLDRGRFGPERIPFAADVQPGLVAVELLDLIVIGVVAH